MTAPAVAGARPTLRVSPSIIASLSGAALAWAGVIVIADRMGNGVGTMDLSLLPFAGMWSLMMAAMMLPAVAPVASLYVRTIPAGHPRRWLLFVAGYLVVWTSVAVPAYLVLRGFDTIGSDTTLRAIAVGVLAAAGAYQLTPLKAVCLRHCRSPLGQLLHYGNIRGPAKELKVATHHAAFCLGCCWMLMVILLALGVMNLWVMLGVAAVLLGEKLLPRGEALARVAGVVFVAVAIVVAVSPRAADAVLPTSDSEMGSDTGGM